MISKLELKSLNKISNSSLLKDIYPMVDRVDIEYWGKDSKEWTSIYGNKGSTTTDNYKVGIYLNDDSITKDNMYEKDFDPYYLVTRYIERDFLNYLGVDRMGNSFWFEVYGPDGSVVLSDR